MRFNRLEEWLEWQEHLHDKKIDLGLERVGAVWARLYPRPFPAIVITVGGTNGKGSSIAFLNAILLAAGYKTGCFTSPHLLRYNERILINGIEADDQLIIQAFDRVDRARDGVPLTYFEFSALAALDIFCSRPLDVVVLEVGLGGRLDAVNILDADAALIGANVILRFAQRRNIRNLQARQIFVQLLEDQRVLAHTIRNDPNLRFALFDLAAVEKLVDEIMRRLDVDRRR